MGLHVLGCPDHELTVFGKCYPNINSCLSTFGANCSASGTAVTLFPDFWGKAYLSLY